MRHYVINEQCEPHGRNFSRCRAQCSCGVGATRHNHRLTESLSERGRRKVQLCAGDLEWSTSCAQVG